MKNIKFLFLLVATLCASAFTACQQDWEPGQPDSESCVYFPVDVTVAAFADVDNDETPVDESKTALFPVYRQGTGEAMTVEIRSRFINPTQVVYRETDAKGNVTLEVTVEQAFTVAESVTFKKGKNKAELEISLNPEVKSLSVGQMYEIEILVKETKHQGNYGLFRKTFSVGIPETWKDLGDDYEEADLKLGTYTEDFFVSLYGMDAGNMVYITIEESEARPGIYRMKNVFSQDNVVQLLGGVPSDMSFASGDTYILIDARDPKEVYIPYQYSGIGIPGYMDEFWIASGKAIGATNAKLEDKVISFPAKTVGLLDGQTGSGRYANESGKMRVTLPGKSMKDYSFSVAHSGTEVSADNSSTRAYFDFTVGADVSKYRFVVVEGNAEAYQTKTSAGPKPVVTTEAHPALQAMLDSEYIDGVPQMEGIEDEATKAYLENSAESAASSSTWYISMPKANLYTMFAVPYDEKRECILDENGLAKVAKVLFYYNPANQDQVDIDTNLSSVNILLGSLADIMGGGDPEAIAYYEEKYPSSFALGMDIQTDDADLVTNLAWYYSKTADLPEGIDPTTKEGQMALMDMAGDDSDISYLISSLKEGGNPLLINGSPDTEYTIVVAVTSLYGKTHYYTRTAKTTPYNFDLAFGTFEFVDGESKMTIEFEPFHNASYGLMFYMKWIVEDNAPDIKVREYPMVAFTEPQWNAIVCYGQVNGYSGTFFAYDYDNYGGDADKVWGFHSSSTPTYNYDYESMVLYYDENGVIESLGTYFRQYVKTFVVNEKDETEVHTEYIKTFAPETTTITCLENKKPVNVPEQPEQGEDTPADDEQGGEAQPTKMGVSRDIKPAKLQLKRDLSFSSVSIQ